MNPPLTFAEVHAVNRMTKAELCHWLRNDGGLIYSHGPLESESHTDLVTRVCDILRERKSANVG